MKAKLRPRGRAAQSDGNKNTRGGGQKTRNCVLFLGQAAVLQYTVPQLGPSYPSAYNPAGGGGFSLNSARICASGPEADVCLKAKKLLVFDRQAIISSHSRQGMRVGKARCPTVQKPLELPNEPALLLSFLLPQNNHHSESRISYLLPHIFTTCVRKQNLVSFSWSKPYVSSKCH